MFSQFRAKQFQLDIPSLIFQVLGSQWKLACYLGLPSFIVATSEDKGFRDQPLERNHQHLMGGMLSFQIKLVWVASVTSISLYIL